MIEKRVIESGKIIEFVLFGPSEKQDIMDVMKHEYPLFSKGILWNFEHGSNSHLPASDMDEIALYSKQYTVHSKTAYYALSDLEYGMLRMYESYAKIAKAAVQMRIFKHRELAIEWLRE